MEYYLVASDIDGQNVNASRYVHNGEIEHALNQTQKTKRKLSGVEITCVVLGVLNIVLSLCVLVSCLIVWATGNTVFAVWLIPELWGDQENTQNEPLGKEQTSPGEVFAAILGGIIAVSIISIYGLCITIAKAASLLFMSVILTVGILWRVRPMVLVYIVYTAVTLPLCLLVNIYYLLLLGQRGVTEPLILSAHIGLSVFILIFALELVLVSIAFVKMKRVGYNPSVQSECETLQVFSKNNEE